VAGPVLALGLIAGLAACSGDNDDDPSTSPSVPVVESTADPSAEPSVDPEADPSADPSADPETDPSADPEASPTPEPITPSSDLEALVVEGEPPTVAVPAPWAVDQSRNKVLTYGTGPTVPSGGLVKVNYVGVNGRTGEVFDNSFDSGQPVAFSLSGVVAGFAKGLAGQRVGSRVLLAMPGSDGYDGADRTEVGIAEGDTLVFVVDVNDTPRSGPQGDPVAPAAGLPVVGGSDSRPTLSLPDNAVFPTGVIAQPLITGSGETITAWGQIQVDYTEYAWSPDGAFRFVRQTYGHSPVTGVLGDAIAGWQEALAGAAQGSRLLVVVPPDQGYPNGDARIGVKAGDASVFVVDVLFA
jgi:peptidylprolyl isomerase